jgi:hypothetical protein
MPKIRHSLTGAVYDVVDGVIIVELDGRTGRFHPDGRWIDGDIRIADPHLCGWLGGRQLPSRYERLITTDEKGNVV